MNKAILLLWPLPIWLFAAEKVLKKKKMSIDNCEIVPTGKNLLMKKLTAINQGCFGRDFTEIIILVSLISEKESEQIRKILKELTGRNRFRIHWFTFANEPAVENICRRISGIEYNPDLLSENLENDVSADIDGTANGRRALTYKDFLRYKISLAFFGDADGRFAEDQIRESIRDLSLTKKEFIRKHKNSLANYRKSYPAIEGRSPQITALKKEIHRLAQADNINVLLSGETGTGKEAVAFFIHDLSSRREKPYGAVNCAGLHEELLHSTLFGHKKGAFSGATSYNPGLMKSLDGGTLFLDELPDMPIRVQTMFLRFLEDGTFTPLGGTREDEQYADIRVIGAAQPDLLRQRFRDKLFRDDLYFRIAEKTLAIPPLRELKEDFQLLVTHLSYKIGQDMQRERYHTIDFFTSREDDFTRHQWPGNVRELAGYIKRRLKLGRSEEESILSDLNRYENSLKHDMAISVQKERVDASAKVPVVFQKITEASAIYTHRQIVEKYINHVYTQLSSRGFSKAEICRKLGIANQKTLNNYLQIHQQT